MKLRLRYKEVDPKDRRVITGTGRSGTKFTAHLLREAGLPATHEFIYNWKGEDWNEHPRIQVDVAFQAGFKLPIPQPVALQVRDPLKNISSWAATGLRTRHKIIEYNQITGEVRQGEGWNNTIIGERIENVIGPLDGPIYGESYEDHLLGLTQFWCRWNRHCEEHSEVVFRLEDLPNQELADFIGIPLAALKKANRRAQQGSSRTRTTDRKPLTPGDIPDEAWDEFQETAAHYGYQYQR